MNAKLIAAALIFMAIASTANAATCTSIPQYGITWTFDKAYECGQFANGDYWVLGPVTILSITPDFDGSHHGWQSNPMPGYPQGFDSRASTFDPTLVPSLPYNAKPGESIVKSISIEPLENADCRPCLETAAVLTVLAAAPPDNGTTVFRPPYAGTEKPFYFANQLRTELLPMLQPVANTPTLETIKNNFQRVQLDHKLSWSGEYIRPKQNMASYGSGMAIRNAEGALRLMLNDSIEQKMPALINYVQAGIDLYGILKNGGSWGSAISGGGGHPHGRKLPIAFAAVLLNNQEMKDAVHNAGDNIFGENDGVKYSEKAGTVLYAEIECSELVYWKKHADELGIGPNASGSKTCKDPYGYIDGGGNPGSSYLNCCVSQNWKASSIAVRLTPELREVWNDEEFNDFSDRYADFGRWTQPDPCAPITGDCNVTKVTCTSANEKLVCGSDEHCETKTFDTDYGVKYGPDKTNPGECIHDTDPSDGIGRVPQSHGTNKNEGGWGSRFANAMWDAYRINENKCGNVSIDPGENCSSCPQDVRCSAPAICCNATCIEPECSTDANCSTGQYCTSNDPCTGQCADCDVNCSSNTECNDSNSETVDSCENQASCESYCKNQPPTCGGIVCQTGQICCNNTCTMPICTTSSQCNDNDKCTTDSCSNAGKCNAECTYTAIPKCEWKKMSWIVPSCFPIAALFMVTVKDETGAPLEGVEITYGTQKMLTNTEGKVEMLGEKAKYVINATKEGYYPLTARKLASATCKPTYTTTGITPAPAAKGKIKIEVLETPYINREFSIKITDNNSKAVQGAAITYSQQTAETNEQGQATLTAEKSKYIITATTADGSATARILPRTQPSGTSDQNKEGSGATAGLPIIPLDIIALIAIIIIGAAALLKARKQKEN